MKIRVLGASFAVYPALFITDNVDKKDREEEEEEKDEEEERYTRCFSDNPQRRVKRPPRGRHDNAYDDGCESALHLPPLTKGTMSRSQIPTSL